MINVQGHRNIYSDWNIPSAQSLRTPQIDLIFISYELILKRCMSIKQSEHGKRKHIFINDFFQHELKNLKGRKFSF